MKKSLIAIAVLIILGLSAYILMGDSSGSTGKITSQNVAADSPADARVINVEATRFTYSPEVITVKKGERIKIVVDNKDTTHGIAISDLGLRGIDSIEFTADKVGTYEFYCPTFCGNEHREMKGTLVITD